MKERLELVRYFAELRAGMIVVLKDCHLCSHRAHRGILVLFTGNDLTRDPDGNVIHEDTWEASPVGNCGVFVFAANDVNDGVVYRVVDPGLENTTDTTAPHKIPATKKKRERA